MTVERKIKGRIAEASVLKHFVSLGYDVFTGYTDNNKHDLLVFDGNKILRVFVRYSSYGNNVSWTVTLSNVYRSKLGNVVRGFEPEHFDLVAVYIEPEDRVVLLDADIPNKFTLSVPKLNPEPKNRHGSYSLTPKPQKDLCECGGAKKIGSERCVTCAPKFRGASGRHKIDWPSDADLLGMVEGTNYSATARKLGVSDNAVRKRLSQLVLER